jgi:putative transposase
MTVYRRAYMPGALAERRGNRLLIDKIDALRVAFAYTKQRQPFRLKPS